jgi:hypothetical protein
VLDVLYNILAMYMIMIAACGLQRISAYSVEVVNRLVFHFFLPVTIFFSIIQITDIDVPVFAKMALLGFVVLLLTCLVTALVVRIRGLGVRDRAARTFMLGASYGNHIFLGLPVAFAFFGNKGVVLALFYLIGGYFFLCIIGLYIMAGRITILDFFKNALVIATMAGVAGALLGLRLPPFLHHTLSLMNSATFPLSMVVVGGGLDLTFFRKSENILSTLVASVIKLLISPMIAYGTALLLSMDVHQLGICVLQSAMPTAVLVTIFSMQYRGESVFSNSIVSLTTLVSIGTIPLISIFLQFL